MQYNDIMTMTAPYFSYALTANEPIFYYNFVPSSATCQKHICIFAKKDKKFLDITTNSFLQTRNGEDMFLVFTNITITADDKDNISLKDQQILRNKVEEFRVDYPELFI